jgi:VWFA-related protein
MRFRFIAAFLLWAAAARSQSPPTQSQPEMASEQAPFTFSSRVNLVSVPVVVRDRDGRAIGNLHKQDFQLFDKGKSQLITKFSIEKAGAALEAQPGTPVLPQSQTPPPSAPSLPDHYVAYLFDDVHLQRGDLLQTRQAVNRHLDESLEPTARAAIFTTSGVMLSDFTSDREKLHKAVDSVQPYSSGIDREQDCPSVSYYEADLLINKFLYLDGHLFKDGQLVQMIQNGTADASLVRIYGGSQTCAPCQRGTVDSMSGADMCDVQALITARTAARRALTFGDHEAASALGALRDVIRRLSVMPGSRNLVLVSPGFLLTRDHQAGEYDLLDRAIRSGVTINTIDMRGLFTIIPGGSADQKYHDALSDKYDREAATQADDILEELADGSGGTFFHNDNRLKEGLNQLAARPEYLYVLGFSPDNLKYDGSYHSLKVAVRNYPGITLQARRGYWAPRHEVDAAEAVQEVLREAMFSHDEVGGIPVDVQTEFFKSTDVKAELTVTARLRLENVRFRKAEERNDDTLTVVAGLFDSDGNYISGLQRVIRMHLRDETLAALERTAIAVKENFNVAPGRYIVRLVVRDAEGDTMAARNTGVEIP